LYEPHDKLKNEARRNLSLHGLMPRESLPNAKAGRLGCDRVGCEEVSDKPTCSVFVSTTADLSLQYVNVKISEIDAISNKLGN
jgi:hypothetical protein